MGNNPQKDVENSIYALLQLTLEKWEEEVEALESELRTIYEFSLSLQISLDDFRYRETLNTFHRIEDRLKELKGEKK